MKPLFVCHANVCRSQFAEAYYNLFTESRDASSAGVADFSSKYSKLPDMMFQLTREEGYNDFSSHRCKPLTEEMVELSDRIFVMCERADCPSFLANSPKTQFWEVPDPVGYTYEQTREVRNQIRALVQSILPPLSGKNRKI